MILLFSPLLNILIQKHTFTLIVNEMKFEESHYVGYDGVRMHMNAWLPDDDKPRAILITFHGLGSHGKAHHNIGEYFSKKGIAVFAPDMRGFGHFDGIKGHVMRFDEYVEDIHNIVMQVKDRYHNRLTFIHGHSIGAQWTICYSVEYPRETDGMILTGPAISEQLPIGKGTRIAVKLLSLLNVKKPFPNGVTLEWLSRDPEVVKAHQQDELRYEFATARFASEGLKTLKKSFNAAPLVQIPTLVQQAGVDKIVRAEKTKEFFDILGSPDKTWHFYEGLYHEVFNEPEKEQVLRDMENWLEKRLPT